MPDDTYVVRECAGPSPDNNSISGGPLRVRAKDSKNSACRPHRLILTVNSDIPRMPRWAISGYGEGRQR